MKFTITTDDIQRIVIALIESQITNRHSHSDVMTEEWYEAARDKLTELNRLCSEDNNYTLSITVKEN